MSDRVAMLVECEEVIEATRELAFWSEHRELLPGHLRDRIDALDPDQPRSVFMVDRSDDVLTIGLVPEVRALLASLRAHRR